MNPQWQNFLVHEHAQFEQDNLLGFTPIPAITSAVEAPCLLTDMSHFTNIEVSGIDAAQFLQGQLSCDVASITPEISCLGAYCNQKGRVMSLFRLWQRDECYCLTLPQSIAGTTLAQLRQYGIFSKITLQIQADDWIGLGIAGAKASTLLQQYVPKLNPQANSVTIIPQGAILSLGGDTSRFILFSTLNQAITWWQRLSPEATCVGHDAWNLLTLRAGIPTLTPELVGQHLAHPLNLVQLNALNFKKGCYLGQEIIARTHYRGKVKKHMAHFSVSTQTAPKPLDDIIAHDQVVGSVINAVPSGPAQFEILAIVQDAVRQAPLVLAASPDDILTLLTLPYTLLDEKENS